MCFLSASSIGLCTNSIGVFYTPVSESLKVLKGTFAFHDTLSSLAIAIVSLFMAKIMRRVNYKKVLLCGVLLASISTLFMAFSNSVHSFYVLGILRGIGAGLYGMVPITIIIINWFVEKHGISMSLALSFSGLSGAIFSPLLSTWIINYGWKITYILMSICIFVLTVPALIYPWQVDPKKSGLLPYGFKEENNIETIIVQRKFNFITISFICMCFFTVMHTSIIGISKHLSGIATSIDLSATIGAAMMSLAMIGNIISKLMIGFISDILNPIKACIIMILINVIAICFLMNGIISIDITLLLIGSFVFGTIYSVGAVGIPLLTKYFFGQQNYSQTYSIIGFLTNVGSSSSLAIIGYIYDFTGGYELVMIITIIFHIINLMLLLLITSRYNTCS